MNTALIHAAQLLRDEELVSRVKSLAARERGATAELVAHLAELEARKLHLAAGYPSMFVYCRDALLLSEHEAYNRIEVARAARRFPMILDLLVQGDVNLTTVRLLAPHLTAANHAEVLQSARRLRTRDVEQIVARLAPAPDVPASIRRLPAPAPAAPPVLALPTTVPSAAALEPAAVPTPVARATVSALSPERYRMQLTISGEILQKLELAKDLLRHANPSGDDATVLDRALDARLADLMRKKTGHDPPRMRRPDHDTYRRTSNARSSCATVAAVPTWAGVAVDATNAHLSSSITYTRIHTEAPLRLRTWSCAANGITRTSGGWRTSDGRKTNGSHSERLVAKRVRVTSGPADRSLVSRVGTSVPISRLRRPDREARRGRISGDMQPRSNEASRDASAAR